MRVLVFIILISFCFAYSNLRKSTADGMSQCQKPCFSQREQLLNGAVIGYVASVDNSQSINIPSSFFQNDFLYLCCDQQRTFDFLGGLIVPDFVDVSKLNVDDINQIQANITNGESGLFTIQINHHFQRVALQASANTQPQANITTILQNINPNQCVYPRIYTSWDNVYLNLGKKVVTSMYLGCEFSIQIYIQSTQQYTQQEIINIYWQHIQNSTIQNLYQKFENSKILSWSSWTRGVSPILDKLSYQDILKAIGLQNYTYLTPLKQFNIQSDIILMDSYALFRQESQDIQDCSQKQWNYRYQKTQSQ